MFWLALVALLFALFALRFLGGVPRPATASTRLADRDVAFVEAAAAAFLPEGPGGLARSGAHAGVTAFLDRYLEGLPIREQRLIRAMLVFFEHSTLLFPARGAGGFRRFSRLSPDQRVEVLEGWANSKIGARRSLFTALRAVIVMGAMSHPDNLEALALDPWEIESPIIEADLLYPEVGQSSGSIEFGEGDLTLVRDMTPLQRDRGAS